MTHWNPQQEHLVLVGDLIDRGKHSAKVVAYLMQLTKQYSNTTILKGNHEAEAITYFKTGDNPYWLPQGGRQTLADFQKQGLSNTKLQAWFENFPLIYETQTFTVTHAGISDTTSKHTFDENHPDSVLWNRNPLDNCGKLQIHGHSPLHQHQPQYSELSNSWNIDTGACYGFGLSGLKIDTSQIWQPLKIEIVAVPTHELDR